MSLKHENTMVAWVKSEHKLVSGLEIFLKSSPSCVFLRFGNKTDLPKVKSCSNTSQAWQFLKVLVVTEVS